MYYNRRVDNYLFTFFDFLKLIQRKIIEAYNSFTSETGLAYSFRVSDRVYRGRLLKQGFLLLNIIFSSLIIL
jgi:hypothetical protein